MAEPADASSHALLQCLGSEFFVDSSLLGQNCSPRCVTQPPAICLSLSLSCQAPYPTPNHPGSFSAVKPSSALGFSGWRGEPIRLSDTLMAAPTARAAAGRSSPRRRWSPRWEPRIRRVEIRCPRPARSRYAAGHRQGSQYSPAREGQGTRRTVPGWYPCRTAVRAGIRFWQPIGHEPINLGGESRPRPAHLEGTPCSGRASLGVLVRSVACGMWRIPRTS